MEESRTEILTKELSKMIRAGKTVSVFYGEGNINNQIRHIREIVDENQVVYRVWSKAKKRWIYNITHMYDFYLLLDHSFLFQHK